MSDSPFPTRMWPHTRLRRTNVEPRTCTPIDPKIRGSVAGRPLGESLHPPTYGTRALPLYELEPGNTDLMQALIGSDEEEDETPDVLDFIERGRGR